MMPDAKPKLPRASHSQGRGILFLLGAPLFVAAIVVWYSAHSKQETAGGKSDEVALNPTPVEQTQKPEVPAHPPAPPVMQHSYDWSRSTNATLIARLFDASLSLKDRRLAARALAKIGTEEALAALKAALADSPSALKAAIGEALGQCPNPNAVPILQELVNGNDEVAARGAVLGLRRRSDDASADVLGQVLFDTGRPQSVRAAAALALADFNQDAALQTLIRAGTEIQDDTLMQNILAALGKRPFAQTQEFFRNYLETPNLSSDMKVSALEALASNEGQPAPLLLKYAADPDSDVRDAALWALSTSETQTAFGPQLLDLLSQEKDASVRARLYEALENQQSFDLASVLAQVQKETAPDTRLAGLALLSKSCGSAASPDLLNYFNQTAVPELKNIALSGEDAQDRLNAATALGQAGTPDALAALQEIASHSGDGKVVQICNGFATRSPGR